jgi:hypothetical protein
MTTTEHLQLIKSECERLLASPIATPRAKAGWRSTIAAINGLEAAHLALADGDDTAWNALEQIAAAWPLELLQQTK